MQRMLKVRKPEWEIGAKSEVKSQPPSKWTVDVDEDELLDDNDFLTEDDLKPPPLLAGLSTRHLFGVTVVCLLRRKGTSEESM